MKKISLFIGVFISLVLFSCKKENNTNPLADFKNLGIGSYLTRVSDINLNMDYNAPASKVGILVTEYKGAHEVSQIVLYVVQGANADPTTWKKIKTIDYTGDSTEISATEQEVATALGVEPSELAPGGYCTFYNQIITKTGERFDLSNTPGALESNSNYNSVFRWAAYITCPFTGGMEGDYEVIQDDWLDWTPGDIVHVTDGPGANQINLSEVWPNPSYGELVDPLIVNVNPANGTASIPSVTFAQNYPGTAVAQGASDGDVAGYVFSCTHFITLNIHITYSGADYGVYKLILKKQE